MEKLEKCPHCDGAASLRETSYAPDPHDPWTFVEVFVKCDECGARGPEFEYCCNGDEQKKKECEQAAIDGWNRRPTQEKG